MNAKGTVRGILLLPLVLQPKTQLQLMTGTNKVCRIRIKLVGRQQSARGCHLAITPLADVRVPHSVHLLPAMQSSSTLGAIWTSANGVRLSRVFMFPVKSADLHKRQSPCGLAATRHPCIRHATVNNGLVKPVKYSVRSHEWRRFFCCH